MFTTPGRPADFATDQDTGRSGRFSVPARLRAAGVVLSLAGLLSSVPVAAQQGMSPTEFARASAERTQRLDVALEQWRAGVPARYQSALKADVIAPLDHLVARWARADVAARSYPACEQATVRLRRIAVGLHHDMQTQSGWFNDAHRDYQNKMTACRWQLSHGK